MIFSNSPLQVGVDYMANAKAGAINPQVPSNVDSLLFGDNLADDSVLGYGQFVVYDDNGGATIPVYTPAAGEDPAVVPAIGDWAGVVAYRNGGITEENGLQKGGLYKNVPVLNLGRIFAKVTSGASLVVGDAVSVNLAVGANFNTVRKLPDSPAASDVDISSIAKVASNSSQGLVELTIIKYLK
jgi:hypothetical protein